jgi:hypothetical protein
MICTQPRAGTSDLVAKLCVPNQEAVLKEHAADGNDDQAMNYLDFSVESLGAKTFQPYFLGAPVL